MEGTRRNLPNCQVHWIWFRRERALEELAGASFKKTLPQFEINNYKTAEPLAAPSEEVYTPLSLVCAPPLPPLSNVALEPVLFHRFIMKKSLVMSYWRRSKNYPKWGKATMTKKKRQPPDKMKEWAAKEVNELFMIQGKIMALSEALIDKSVELEKISRSGGHKKEVSCQSKRTSKKK